MNPEGRTQLPGIAFRSFLQRLEEPTLGEGFQDIYRVDFEVRLCIVKCIDHLGPLSRALANATTKRSLRVLRSKRSFGRDTGSRNSRHEGTAILTLSRDPRKPYLTLGRTVQVLRREIRSIVWWPGELLRGLRRKQNRSFSHGLSPKLPYCCSEQTDH